jgi:transcriptional regulator with GAF, ATPase, and Fis domain
MDEHRLARLMASLQQTDDASSVLERLCRVCALSTGLAGAGVTRFVDGVHETLVATDPTAHAVETLQVEFAEGPCVEAIASRHRYLEPDLSSLRAQQRWPRFSAGAVEHGVNGAFAFPLIAGGQPLGALDVYSHRRGDLTPDQLDDSMLLADLATLAIEHVGAPSQIDGVDLAAEPSEPWAHAGVVHHASGMVSAQLDIDVDEALLRLRAVAFVTGRPLADVARDVVDRELRIQSWADHE